MEFPLLAWSGSGWMICVHVCYGVQQVDRTGDALLTVAASLQRNMHTLTAVKTHFIVSLHGFCQEDLTAENRPSVRKDGLLMTDMLLLLYFHVKHD